MRGTRGSLGGPPPPFALTRDDTRGVRLAAVTAEAEACGLTVDMRLTDARALCPTLRTSPETPEEDTRFLAGLCRWSGRYTPWSGPDGRDGLILDITGCAHLFGGERPLLEDLADRLDGLGLTSFCAIADTRGAAWGLARYGDGLRQADPGKTREAVTLLPVAALRLDGQVLQDLDRLGLRSVGDLLALPRASLARRFGLATVRRLDQMLGVEPEPVSPAAPPLVRSARLSLPDPLVTTEAVLCGLDRLLERLLRRLEARGEGIRQMVVSIRRVDGSGDHAPLGLTRPSRDAALLRRLCEPVVSRWDAGFGIDRIGVEATLVEPLAPAGQQDLSAMPSAACDPTTLEALWSRLGNRFGFEALLRLEVAETHSPERRTRLVPIAVAGRSGAGSPAGSGSGTGTGVGQAGLVHPRPLRLFPPEAVQVNPEVPGRPPPVFDWRRTRFRVVRARGPERLTPEWWRSDPGWRGGLRDYWWVQTLEGPRLWMFHLPQGQQNLMWFVHGEFP